ncbi:uncharacterized protein C8R40DRAFT_1178632 [Lentinula edodes]|uniref:uncharacterized protein n=1 Tax=Lentinula edodes TaxID=5353 RepID=UPI001E8EB6DE|nr:uncharacterized protein C8R40DRAFT_1178632 [Lentinula edodes]KAH7867777.1 hypothetical protein C8R40DRAFT_1178632 [Lentinula edodes]
MDSVMLMWEGMIEAYICEVLGYPASPDHVPPLVETPSSNALLPAITSLVTDDARSMLGASIPVPRRTPLFLPGSLLPTSPHSPSPIPSSPCVLDISHKVVDLTIDDAEDLYELQEEFLARTGGAATLLLFRSSLPLLPVTPCLSLPIPPVCPSKPPPHPPVHPFQEKPNASATAATSLDGSRANFAGAQGSLLSQSGSGRVTKAGRQSGNAE